MWYYLLIAVLTLADASVYNGSCPELTAVEIFNRTAWAETWYVISKYPDDPVILGTCPFGRYTPNGNLYVTQEWYNVDDVQNYIEGSASPKPNSNGRGEFDTFRKYGSETREYSAYVLLTDYTNYAVFHNCQYDSQTNTHKVFPWTLSRTKFLEGEYKSTVDQFIQNSSVLDASKFQLNDFSEDACSFNSTKDLSTVS